MNEAKKAYMKMCLEQLDFQLQQGKDKVSEVTRDIQKSLFTRLELELNLEEDKIVLDPDDIPF